MINTMKALKNFLKKMLMNVIKVHFVNTAYNDDKHDEALKNFLKKMLMNVIKVH